MRKKILLIAILFIFAPITLAIEKTTNTRIPYNQSQRNCTYLTTDGVCFTTQIFEVKPLEIENYKYNLWLAAKDACESQGYKLPNDYELRSLISDIWNIYIYSGINIATRKDSQSLPAKNYEILKKIAPKKEFQSFFLWENEEFDNDRAYIRKIYESWGEDITIQIISNKYTRYMDTSIDTICVYNPNGKPYKSLAIIAKEKKVALERQKKEEQKQKELIQQREAENKRQKELQRQQEEQRLEQEKIKQQQEKERIYNEVQKDLF